MLLRASLFLLLAASASCSLTLDEEFLKEEDTFSCVDDGDCLVNSGYKCLSNRCVLETTSAPCVDEDMDGFAVDPFTENCRGEDVDATRADPDDTNADVNPDADEYCDGVDNDGDEEIDEIVSCTTNTDCPSRNSELLSLQILYECERNQGVCEVRPLNRGGACATIVIACTEGNYDLAAARAEECVP